MLLTVGGVGNRRRVQNDIRLFPVHQLFHSSFIRCGQHPFGKGAQRVSSGQLAHNACTDKAARAGDKNLFHTSTSQHIDCLYCTVFAQSAQAA